MNLMILFEGPRKLLLKLRFDRFSRPEGFEEGDVILYKDELGRSTSFKVPVAWPLLQVVPSWDDRNDYMTPFSVGNHAVLEMIALISSKSWLLQCRLRRITIIPTLQTSPTRERERERDEEVDHLTTPTQNRVLAGNVFFSPSHPPRS